MSIYLFKIYKWISDVSDHLLQNKLKRLAQLIILNFENQTYDFLWLDIHRCSKKPLI